ncbi:DUF5376 family protein [Psychrobacter sp. ANT_WB68]|uniref:DUF5376 family protein n=1 Tax=Psychrobacter sp. ANT_WB68 TaxID=2597355 RepID=UPI0011F14A9C|nr:DUF5376 family protein [Psychrobacter sp. ANT_WB68]KAA0915572.1 hypothetical protein FQ084_03230 [Psychrobacter sp. ANT_WB68]
MSIAFYYFKNEDWDRLIPSCRPLDNSNEMRMLSYYLSELDIEFSENILTSLEDKNTKLFDISSETWQIVVDGDNVILSSIYDEDNNDFKATIKRNIFEKFVVAWANFLKQDSITDIVVDS